MICPLVAAYYLTDVGHRLPRLFILMSEPSPEQIRKSEKVAIANELLARTCSEMYPVSDMECAIMKELSHIRTRLDRIGFAIQYPEQAEKNNTLQ